MVNSRKLNNKPGYSSHSVVLKGLDGDHFFLHDPSFPISPHRSIEFSLFESAWAYPSDKIKTITAIRLRKA